MTNNKFIPFVLLPTSEAARACAEDGIMCIPRATVREKGPAYLAMTWVVEDIQRISLSRVGIKANADYVELARNQLRTLGYPPDRLDDPEHEGAVCDVNAVVRMIVAMQNLYVERIAKITPELFDVSTAEYHDTSYMRRFMQGLARNNSFLHNGQVEKLPFLTKEVVEAICGLIEFRSPDDYKMINHRLIALTAVGIHHGLVSWSTGRYYPEYSVNTLEMRQNAYREMRLIWDRCYPPPNEDDPLMSQRLSVKVCVGIQVWAERDAYLLRGDIARARVPYIHNTCTADNYMTLVDEEDMNAFDGAVMSILRDHDMGGQLVGVFEAMSSEAINAEVVDRGTGFTANSPEP